MDAIRQKVIEMTSKAIHPPWMTRPNPRYRTFYIRVFLEDGHDERCIYQPAVSETFKVKAINEAHAIDQAFNAKSFDPNGRKVYLQRVNEDGSPFYGTVIPS